MFVYCIYLCLHVHIHSFFLSRTRNMAQLALGSQDLEFLTAQQQVAETQLADGTHIENPLVVNEEINFKKEEFAKLKFQYLEQETREKFLRAILSSPPLYVEQKDIDEYEAQNREKKAQLKSLKTSMNTTLQNIQEKNSQNVSLYQDLLAKLNDTDELLKEISDMESSLRSLFPNDPQLVDAMLQPDMGDDNLFNIATSAQQKLAHVQSEHSRAEAHLSARKQTHRDRQDEISKLSQQLEKVHHDIDAASKSPTARQDPQQSRAQWIKLMTEILQETGIKLDITEIEGRYKIKASADKETIETELDAKALDAKAVSRLYQDIMS